MIVLDDGTVRVDFVYTDGTHELRDCLNLTAEEYAASTEQSLLDMQQLRFNKWVDFINTPIVTE